MGIARHSDLKSTRIHCKSATMARRNYAHVVDVAFWDYMTRIVQTMLALALVILSAWLVVFVNTWPDRLSLFAAAWDLTILGYYNIAVHGLPFIYNWGALVVTESLTLVFWAASFSSVAAYYAKDKYDGRLNEKIAIAVIALGAFAFVLHLATCYMFARAVHKHRRAGKPLFSPQGKVASSSEV